MTPKPFLHSCTHVVFPVVKPSGAQHTLAWRRARGQSRHWDNGNQKNAERTSNLLNIKNESILIMLGFMGGGGVFIWFPFCREVFFLQCQDLYLNPEGFMWSLWSLDMTWTKLRGETGGFPSGRHIFVPVGLHRAAASPTPWDCWHRRLSHHGFAGIRAHGSPWMELPCRMWDGSSSMGGEAMPSAARGGQGSGVDVSLPCWQQHSHLDVSQEPCSHTWGHGGCAGEAPKHWCRVLLNQLLINGGGSGFICCCLCLSSLA